MNQLRRSFKSKREFKLPEIGRRAMPIGGINYDLVVQKRFFLDQNSGMEGTTRKIYSFSNRPAKTDVQKASTREMQTLRLDVKAPVGSIPKPNRWRLILSPKMLSEKKEEGTLSFGRSSPWPITGSSLSICNHRRMCESHALISRGCNTSQFGPNIYPIYHVRMVARCSTFMFLFARFSGFFSFFFGTYGRDRRYSFLDICGIQPISWSSEPRIITLASKQLHGTGHFVYVVRLFHLSQSIGGEGYEGRSVD
ncbi:hypothetical protein Tco_0481493 [Tanacetum coccineum]